MVERYRPRATSDADIAHMPAPRVSRRASIKKGTIARQNKTSRDFRKQAGTSDSFVNYALNIGIGTNNALSQSQYGFNPITRIRTLLDWIHRGSWLGGVAIDLLADDMTRAGIEILSTNDPEDVEKLRQGLTRLQIWKGINGNIKWSRLYGGSIAVMLIDGQNPETPLRIDAVGKNQFKGLMVLDRWMVEPDLQRLVREYGPHLGLPEFYRVVSDAPAMRNQRIHYTRVMRLEGIELPYWQRVMENLWGLSIFERLYDRMVAFDSATQGAAQLVYKSYVRTYAIDGLHDAVTTAGNAIAGIANRVEFMRKYQGIEGVSLIDGKDRFEAHQATSFSGISDALLQFAQQLSGALQIPLVRLLGQSPAGLNSTGEADLRTYYDNILQMQERDLREGMNVILRVLAQSLGIQLPQEFNFNFVPLWQLNETEKSDISDKDTRMILEVEAAGLVSARTALQELREGSKRTGRWTNIDDAMIEEASDVAEPPEVPGVGGAGAEGEEGGGEEGNPAEAAQQGAQEGAEAGAKAGGAKGVNIAGLEASKKIRKAVGGEGGDRALDAYGIPFTEIGGIQVVVEQRAGTIRSGDGWSVVMDSDYGYIRRIGSAEGSEEWLDCFCGPYHSSRDVWVVDAVNPETGQFDEHKVLLGYRNSRDAIESFKKSYDDQAARRIGAITHFSMDEWGWKRWLAGGDKTKPLAMDRAQRVA